MKTKIALSILFVTFLLCSNVNVAANEIQSNNKPDTTQSATEDQLVVVWTSGDKEVAMNMVLMYTYNAKKYDWWEDITLLVWGPSQKILTTDKEVQEYIKKIRDVGVTVLACKACANKYGVANKLSELGLEVKYTGKDLTDFIKNRKVITF
ncbi:MAG: DsrE family protein [Bacteroidales bacterium]|nr:DsrE family protein [Bacteroidales bacterium]